MRSVPGLLLKARTSIRASGKRLGESAVTVRPNTYTRMIDCTDRTAYLAYRHTATGISKQSWKCIRKPRVIPPNGDQPGPCPTDCKYLEALHSTCYSSTQQCSSASGTVYLTALQEREYAGSVGGDWGLNPSSRGTTNKHAQASCGKENIGKNVCWPPPPVHPSTFLMGVAPRIRLENLR